MYIFLGLFFKYIYQIGFATCKFYLFAIEIQSIVVKTPLSRTGSEACETCGQYQRQLAELQRQLLLVKAEKDEALKLKEEVNHGSEKHCCRAFKNYKG